MQLARLRVLKQRGYRHSDGDRRDAISPLEGIETSLYHYCQYELYDAISPLEGIETLISET